MSQGRLPNMTLRSQAHALIGRFIADIDSIIREHAARATARALAERGLAPGRAKRVGRATPLKLVPPEPEIAPKKRRKKAAPPKARALPKRKPRKASRKTKAEQLTLF